MIYEYASLACFLLLSLTFLFASFYYSNLQKSIPVKKTKGSAQKSVTRAESLDLFLRILIVLLLVARAIIYFFAPVEILASNQPDHYFIRYILSAFFLSVFWVILYILLLFKKEIKTENRSGYQKMLLLSIMFFILIDLSISIFFFVRGYVSFFVKHFSSIPRFTMQDVESMTPLLIFILILLVIQAVLYTLFFVRRSLIHVRQYWISMFLYISIFVFYLLTAGLYIIGWQESTIIQLKIFSIQYGYIGYIFMIFFAILIVCNTCGFTFLQLRKQMTNSQRARNLLSPLLKIGFMGLWGASIIGLMPHLLIWFY